MKANELRIGNLVYNHHNEIASVDINTFNKFKYPTMDGNPAKIFPIPLTEEILFKCGFVHAPNLDDNAFIKEVQLWERETIIRIDHFNVNDRWRFVFSICQLENEYLYDGNKLKDLKTEEIEKEIPIKEFEYLHDLQNIYHSLTNEELQIEL